MPEINHKKILEMGRYQDLSLEGIEAGEVLAMHRFMVRLRRTQEALIKEYHPADEIRCPVHFCVGQEAVPAALSRLLLPEDYLFSHHRSHGYYLAKGAPITALFAELYGRETGANGGMAGSQDISWPGKRFYSGAILSGAVAMATGAALGVQMKQRPDVVVAGFGEAAADEGIFWEAMSYAALGKLPVVFVCENNLYATYSHMLKRQPMDNLSQRVETFGVKSQSLFGNDAAACHSVLSAAFQRAKAGDGPSFLELYTYRWNGHVGPEDDDIYQYRPMEELNFWKDNCPILLLEEAMTTKGLLSPEDKTALIKEIDQEIDQTFQYAKESAFPELSPWAGLNVSSESPLADRLLQETGMGQFDQTQAEAIPGPY